MSDTSDWDIALEDMKQIDAIRNQPNPPEPPKSRRGCALSLGIGFLVILFGGIIGTVYLTSLQPNTQFIPDNPSNFNPPASLQEIQQIAGDDVRFISMTMERVRSDGTMDLNADYEPLTEYVFVRQLDEPPTDAPQNSISYEYVTVTIDGTSDVERTIQPVSAEEDIPERVIPPNCSIADLWQSAKSYDVPANVLATIHYSQDGYRFVIDNLNIDLQFNEDCILIRS